MSEALDDIIEMMEQLLKQYGYQDQQLNKIHGTLSVLEYGYNSLRQELGHAECSASEQIGQSRNRLAGHIDQSEKKLNDITTCLQDVCATLDSVETLVHPCGDGEWRLVIDDKYLHPYNDACPNTWNEFLTGGRRFCARQSTFSNSLMCDSAIFPVAGDEYSRVCGRIVGYGHGSNPAFNFPSLDIESFHVNGLSLTHGAEGSREHIWTFAIGQVEDGIGSDGTQVCPCHPDFNINNNVNIPPVIGDDYFCESGINDNEFSPIHHLDDPLWDGRQCFSECCNSPYFVKTLNGGPTSDPLEIRICNNRNIDNSNILVEEIEIYVQ